MNWFEMWFEDKKSILETMTRNMAADLAAGYDYFGTSIQKQIEDLNEYKHRFDAEMEKLKDLSTCDDGEKKVNRWCYLDMKKRGAIA